MQGTNIHLVKHQGKLLACSSGKTVTVVGFKHSKHASIVKRNICHRHFDVNRVSVAEYKLQLNAKRENDLVNTEITNTALEYFGLICKLNDVQYVIVSDITPSKNYIQMMVDVEMSNKGTYTDMRMIRGNLEKIFTDGSYH